MPLTREEISSIAHDAFAHDLLTEELYVKMASWSAADVEAYFESNGEVLPQSERPMISAKSSDYYELLGVPRNVVRVVPQTPPKSASC